MPAAGGYASVSVEAIVGTAAATLGALALARQCAAARAQQKGGSSTRLVIDGMTCGHCVARIKAVLEGLEGVQSAEVILGPPGSATVVGTASAAELIEAVEGTGKSARLMESAPLEAVEGTGKSARLMEEGGRCDVCSADMLAVDCITPEQWRQFDEQGYVKLSQAVKPHVVKMLQDEIDAVMMGTADVDYDSMMMQLDSTTGNYSDMGVQTLGHKGASLNYRKIQNLDRDPVFMEYMRAPLFLQACRRVYGDGVPISSFRSMFFNKPAKAAGQTAGGTVLPWHQDRWAHLDRDPLLTMYTALDPATEQTGCIHLIPKSHKLGCVNPSHHSGFLTEQQADQHCDPAEEICLELLPGDIALLHNYTIHKSGQNFSQRPRRAYSVNYMDARTVLNSDSFAANASGRTQSAGGLSEGGETFVQIF
jgi:phytanoyl-CoA hydroxylase